MDREILACIAGSAVQRSVPCASLVTCHDRWYIVSRGSHFICCIPISATQLFVPVAILIYAGFSECAALLKAKRPYALEDPSLK